MISARRLRKKPTVKQFPNSFCNNLKKGCGSGTSWLVLPVSQWPSGPGRWSKALVGLRGSTSEATGIVGIVLGITLSSRLIGSIIRAITQFLYSDLQMRAKQNDLRRYQLRKRPTQARAIATVDAVLEAAARILVDTGYSSASTNAIAEQAGVSIGSLYEYFPSKEAIFAELRRREGLRHYQRLTQEPRPATPRAMLRHLVSTHIAYVRDNLELYVALETEVPRFAIEDVESAVLKDYVPLSNAFLEAHQSELRPRNDIAFITELLMRVLTASVNDYALRSPKFLDGPELTEALIDLIGSYLLKDTI
jgi:AcrR family transcriptional regulator